MSPYLLSGGSTTVEQYLYEYDNSNRDEPLSSVTLRRRIDSGAWTNVSRANYTYYEAGDAHGQRVDKGTFYFYE